MKFIFSHVFKSISANVKINAVIVFTLFVAYLFFFLGCCYIEDGLKDMDSFKLKRMENAIQYQGRDMTGASAQRISQKDFDAFFAQYDCVEKAAVLEWNHRMDQLNGQTISYDLIPPDYADFFLINLTDGRFFTPEEMANGAAVCVAEQMLQDTKGLQPGDFVEIGETRLKIVGVIKNNANAGRLLIPKRTMENAGTHAQDLQGYTIAAMLTDEARRFEIDWGKLGLSGELRTAREFYEDGLRFFLARSVVVLLLCAVLLCYALLNLINIMTGKLEAQKRSLGIRLALGASDRQVFAQFFLECLILVLIAVGAVFLLDPVFAPAVKTRLNHTFGVYSAAVMLAASVVSSYFFSRILLSKLKKMDVVTIIKHC